MEMNPGERPTQPIERAITKQATKTPILLPLTPQYDEDKHGVYVDAIEAVLEPTRRLRVHRRWRRRGYPPVRNIALTGSYGVGKSSILLEVARRHPKHVVSLSLSSLGLNDIDPTSQSEAGQNPSHRDDEREGAPRESEQDRTNRIQKEIVKQLLYSQDPLRTPGSRYKRTTRARFWRVMGVSALFATLAALVFYLTGWTASLAKLLPNAADLPWLTPAAVFVGAGAFAAAVLSTFHNRFQIEKLDTGAGTISLSARTATYFDEYLDEIVYLFETSSRTIVIFEDIDRFDSPQIFETLRSLNSILSGARQLRGRSIQFIYAIKDSIFEELGTRAAREEFSDDAPTPDSNSTRRQDAAEEEVARANRTKFFDLVIPVVPFVTHRSARDHVTRTLSDRLDHKVSRKLIELVARHLADMRLIKNIRNEFAIFKHQVIEKSQLSLVEDNLFAMVVYKSVHLSDFELIKLGLSDLDALYLQGRRIVAANTQHLSQSMRAARAMQTEVIFTEDRAHDLGVRLEAHIARTLRHLGADGAPRQPFTLDGAALEHDDIQSVEFWDTYILSDGSLALQYVHPSRGRWETLTFDRDDLADALGNTLEPTRISDERRRRADDEIEAAVAARAFLANADMADLFSRAEFKLPPESGLSFAEAARNRLGSKLAIDLLEGGYFDRNFTLYASTFEKGLLSVNAMNYILKNVGTGTIDMFFPLTPSDAQSIVQDQGDSFWQEPSALNVHLLEYALLSDPTGLDTLVERFLTGSEGMDDLVDEYIQSGAQAKRLVRALAARWHNIFEYLISRTVVDGEARLTLVDAALASSSSKVDYSTSTETGTYLAQHLYDMVTATTESDSTNAGGVATDLLRRAQIDAPRLAGLSDDMQEKLIDAGSYALTRENLQIAVSDANHPWNLDALADTDRRVYRRVIRGVKDYLQILDESQYTVVEQDRFESTLDDVHKIDVDAAEEVIARSAPQLRVTDLATVATEMWPIVAAHDRVDLSLRNVNAYVAQFGFDEPLASALTNAGRVSDAAEMADEDKEKLAVLLLASATLIPSAKIRAELVESMHLGAYLEPDDVPVEEGELVGHLIGLDITADAAATFTALLAGDTSGLAFAISKSTTFIDFMSTAEITPQNVGVLISHDLVPTAVKDAIVQRLTEFAAGASKRSFTIAAQYLLSRKLQPTLDEVTYLARGGATPSIVVQLLRPLLPSSDVADIRPVLDALGGAYKQMGARNGRRPRLAATDSHRALAERLRRLGIVSSVTQVGDELRVNMRR